MRVPLRQEIGAMCSLVMMFSLPLSAQLKDDRMVSNAKLYGFTVKTIDGKERSMAEYKGKVLLIVNVASKCGYTPQYKGLEEIYEKYRDRGFMVLGFPSNDFLWQEPGSDTEIKEFCSTTYNVKFDMFSKIDVKGSGKHPLYLYLTKESEKPHEIKWNFNKFLVDRRGKVVEYYPSSIEPTDEGLTKTIDELLKSPE